MAEFKKSNPFLWNSPNDYVFRKYEIIWHSSLYQYVQVSGQK